VHLFSSILAPSCSAAGGQAVTFRFLLLMPKVLAAGMKRGVKKTVLKEKKPPRMTPDEKRLAREMHFDRKVPPAQVAKAIGRDLSCVCRLLAQKHAPAPIGRPKALSTKEVDNLVSLLEQMVDEADSTYEVTLVMLMKRSQVKACDRVVADALHERGYRFRDLREKPILTPANIKERHAWSKKYKDKSESWWQKNVDVHLDNHMFKCATTVSGRRLLAKRKVRGVYRKRGKSLRPGHVKPSAKLHLPTGAKGILKTGGVGGGRVLVWHTVQGRWGGDEAQHVYTKVVAPALKKRYPKKTSFCVLEDNDPTGNNSGKGIAAKQESKLKVLKIPKHSPDLIESMSSITLCGPRSSGACGSRRRRCRTARRRPGRSLRPA
jgi:hypothetical protein